MLLYETYLLSFTNVNDKKRIINKKTYLLLINDNNNQQIFYSFIHWMQCA